MSTIAAKPSEKGVKGMFKRLTTKLKRKGDKHKDEEETEHNAVGPHEEVEVRVEQGGGHGDDAKKHMKNMLGTEDIDQHDEDEEGKSKAYSEDTENKSKAKKKKNKVEHLLRRSKKYELTKSASKGHLDEAQDEADHDSNANKAKEEDSDANIQAVEEHHKEKGSTIKKSKEEKKRERKERKERKKSLRKSSKQTNEQTNEQTTAVGQNDPVPAAVSQVVATAQPSPAPAVVPATGRPTNGGLIRPLSCPPQPFNGELSAYGLRAIADAIQDVASAIAPELQPKTPQMTLAAFVEGELQHVQLQQTKKPNLPSFDLPPPPSPPRNARMIPGSDSRSTDSLDKSGGRRVRSMASLSQEELATLASSRAPFQSPLPELPKIASVSSPFATTASEVPQFTAQPSAASDTNERVKVSSKGRSGSKRNKKRTSTGPVPTFTLFASSEPVKVPLLPIVLPSDTSSSAVVAHKRKGEHDTEGLTEGNAVIDGAPDAKCARLDEQLPQEDACEKADTEAEFEAVPEVCEPVEGGRRICIEEQKSRRRPSIHPDEIKILQEEEQLMLHNDEASSTEPTGGEVTIYITDSSPSSSTEPSPDVEHNPHQAASESGYIVDERPSVPDAQRAEEPPTVVPVESDAQQDEELNEQEGEEAQQQEEKPSLGSQSRGAQQQPRQNGNKNGGRRNRRGKGKNRALRKQGTKTRLAYR